MNEEPVQVVVPPVEITEVTLPTFEADLLARYDAGVDGLVVDLRDVAFINSAGLATLVKFGMRLDRRGGCLALAGARRQTHHTIRLLGLDRMLPLFPSVAEACAYVEARTTTGSDRPHA